MAMDLKNDAPVSFTIGGQPFLVGPNRIETASSLEQEFANASLPETVEAINSYTSSIKTQVGAVTESALSSHVMVMAPEGPFRFPYNEALVVVVNPDMPNQSIQIPQDAVEEHDDKLVIRHDTEVEITHAHIIDEDNRIMSFYRAPCILEAGTVLSPI